MGMDSIQQISGPLTLGPVRHDGADAVYTYLRVGQKHLERVKIPGVLNSLLRNGQACTLWLATIRTPTPFLFRTKIHIVYAVEIAGQIYRAIDDVARGWTTAKWLMVLMLLGIGAVTILLYVGLLFWINAARLSLVGLPIEDMRRNPA